MKNLRCIIADDEPIARQILENYIGSLPYLNLVASCKNAFEVIEILQEKEVDILFLDTFIFFLNFFKSESTGSSLFKQPTITLLSKFFKK